MIVEFSDLFKLRQEHRGRKLIYAGGVFDILHPGHILALQKFKELGDVLVVGISSDKRVKMRKGNARPVQSQDDRTSLIGAIRYVDYAFVMPTISGGEISPWKEILAVLRPDVFASCDEAWTQRQREIESFGTKLIIVPRQSEHATSTIIEKIRQ